MENYTKEQLWTLLGKYVNHLGEVEGSDFLSNTHVPSKYLTEEDRIAIRQADDDFMNSLK